MRTTERSDPVIPLAIGATAVLALAFVILLRWRPEVLPLLFPGFGHCPWRELTGLPCPTCGGTRAALALSQGEVVAALRANPLVAVGWLGLVPGAVGAAVAARPSRRPSRHPRRRILAVAAFASLGANWVYLILT